MSSAVVFVPIVSAPLNKIQYKPILALQPLTALQTILSPAFWTTSQLPAGQGQAPPSAFSAPLRL